MGDIINESIEFMEYQLKELRKFKAKAKEETDKEDMIEQRLENIEKAIVTIKRAIVN